VAGRTPSPFTTPPKELEAGWSPASSLPGREFSPFGENQVLARPRESWLLL
jgi:hypothetical protein